MDLPSVLGVEQEDQKLTGEYRLGLHAGCFMSKNLNSRISYTSELLFTQKGFIAPSNSSYSVSPENFTWSGQYGNNNGRDIRGAGAGKIGAAERDGGKD